ncbi:MAG TPA: fructosamine kinase family protein, partial [Planctomycetota bacterium]|nr:fructosamine kinase family protein [Planctomycetota bacterium]
MEPELEAAISDAIAQATGRGGRIVDDRSVGGGCISDTRIVELDDGRRLFVKTNDPALAEMFAREAEGLSALSAAGAIRVPTPIATGGGGRTPAFIVLEAIEIGRPSRGFFERFGRELAELHRRTPSARFGFEHDNWIGSTP